MVGSADLGGAGTLAAAATLATMPAMGLGCKIVGDTGTRRLLPTGAVFSSVGGGATAGEPADEPDGLPMAGGGAADGTIDEGAGEPAEGACVEACDDACGRGVGRRMAANFVAVSGTSHRATPAPTRRTSA